MITVFNTVREGTVWFKSGHFYEMMYSNYENDPAPVGVMLNYIRGTHPKTGNYHNYIQFINFTYVPRNFRRIFVKEWKTLLENNHGNVLLTWKKVRSRFPYLQLAIRRYYIGKRFIKFQHEVMNEDLDRIVVSSFNRDFSLVAWKAQLKKKGGPKGSPSRKNLSNKSSSYNKFINRGTFAPVI